MGKLPIISPHHLPWEAAVAQHRAVAQGRQQRAVAQHRGGREGDTHHAQQQAVQGKHMVLPDQLIQVGHHLLGTISLAVHCQHLTTNTHTPS